MNQRIITTGMVVLCLFVVPSAAMAVSLNIDFQSSRRESTHSGANGIYSTTGTVWNGVVTNTNQSNLRNEFGGVTPIGVLFSDPNSTFGLTDAASTNLLQDFGIQVQGLQIVGLSPNRTYDLAGYIGVNAGFAVSDATGNLGFKGFGDPTYVLPGVETIPFPVNQRGDYIQFTGLLPGNLGGGQFGITIDTDGILTGLQIRNVVPEPATLGLAAIAVALACVRCRRS